MIQAGKVKQITLEAGAEKCGIALAKSFSCAPDGFKPTDIYQNCKSVLVFLKSMPSAIITAQNPVPYTNAAYLLYNELDKIGLEVCRSLKKTGINSVPVPADTPYLYWDSKITKGQGILSLRHAAHLAGLGILGRNSLLINDELGNMVYIGALLLDTEFEPDKIVDEFECPDGCSICMDICPQGALNGTTVDQQLCRKISFFKTERGFDIYNCSLCRKECPLRDGAAIRN